MPSTSSGSDGEEKDWDRDWDEPAAAATPERSDQRRSFGGRLVQGVFGIFEFAVLCVLVPIRGAAEIVGRTTVFLVRLPFQLLGMVFNLAGYLAVALILVLLMFAAFSLVGRASFEDPGVQSRAVRTIPGPESPSDEVRAGVAAPEEGR